MAADACETFTGSPELWFQSSLTQKLNKRQKEKSMRLSFPIELLTYDTLKSLEVEIKTKSLVKVEEKLEN